MKMTCNNCAWFCHLNGKCYAQAIQDDLAVEMSPDDTCKDWTSDGLSDEEREEYTLMTMETEMTA